VNEKKNHKWSKCQRTDSRTHTNGVKLLITNHILFCLYQIQISTYNADACNSSRDFNCLFWAKYNEVCEKFEILENIK